MRKRKSGPVGETPAEPSARMKSARLSLGLGQVAMAKDLGVGQSNLPAWERGQTPIPNPVLLALQALYGISHHWLADGSGPMFLSGSTHEIVNTCPALRSAKAWLSDGQIRIPGNAKRIPYPRESLKAQATACGAGEISDFVLVRAVGSGMVPLIPSGAEMLVNTHAKVRSELLDGGVYLVRRSPEDVDARFKRLKWNPKTGTLTLLSDNPIYPPQALKVKGRDLTHWVLGRACQSLVNLIDPNLEHW